MLAAQDRLEVQHQLLARLQQARAETDHLFQQVKPEFLYERPIPERHRIVFYVGHLEAFDWNLLRERVLGRTSFHSEFDNLFAFGIDPVDGGLPSDQPSDWPSLAQVRDYVSQVRQAMDEGLAGTLSQLRGQKKFSPSQLLHVAIEHRLMHAETLAYMLHQLPFDNKVRKSRLPELVLRPVEPAMIEIPAGQATLGLSRRHPNVFGWDNEYEAHTVTVPAFSIDQYEVTNREYLQFIDAGGYENQALWREADWKWKTQQNILHPVFWNRVHGEWQYRAMFESVPLPLDWPVYVSHGKPALTRAGRERFCLPKRSGIAPLTERRREPNGHTPGARTLPTAGSATSISTAGTRLRSGHFCKARAPSASPTWWETDGSGRPPCSPRFPALNRSNFILAIRLIFSMVNIM